MGKIIHTIVSPKKAKHIKAKSDYAEKGIMEDDCTHNPEDWNNKGIK